jgi:pimeloyl-ACP methyl ester carboxylesterase
MPFAEWTGGRGFYARSGPRSEPASDAPELPPVLLIHGAGGTHLDWPPSLRRLPGHVVFAIDLPAHGRSPGPACASIGDASAWLIGMLGALSLPAAVLLGHSMGSAVALQVAMDAPHRAAGLVLISAGARLPVPQALLADAPGLLDRFVDLLYGPDEGGAVREVALRRLAQVDRATLRDDLAACRRWNPDFRAGEITAPALLVAGTDDRLTPLEEARRLHARLPRSTLRLFEGAGHMLPLERAGDVQEAVLSFLAGLSKAQPQRSQSGRS